MKMKIFKENKNSGFTPHITPIKLFREFISNRLCGGFTIVELLVAMSIFVILITIAVGAFIQALRSERRLVALMTVSNNASSVLEQMTREIRTGYLFPSLPVCAESVKFSSSASGAPSDVTYGRTVINGRGVIQRGGQNLTADNVNVSKLCFLVSQDSASLCSPWRVTIMTTVNAFPASAVVSPTTIQTTASSRILPRDMPLSVKAGSQYRYCE